MNDEQKCDFREAIRDKSPVETDPEVLATALSNIGTLSPRLRKVYDDSAALLRAQKAAIDAAVASERERIDKLIRAHSRMSLETLEYLQTMREGPTPAEWAELDANAREIRQAPAGEKT